MDAEFGRSHTPSPAGSVAAGARLVDELRAAGDVVTGLSLVAEIGGDVVGHVVGSRAHID